MAPAPRVSDFRDRRSPVPWAPNRAPGGLRRALISDDPVQRKGRFLLRGPAATPEAVAAHPDSVTGRFLAEVLP